MNALINGLIVTLLPGKGWQRIAEARASTVQVLATHTLPLALIPAICWYWGVTHQGWTVAGNLVKLTPASAAPMCIMFYIAMVAGVLFLAYMVHWMSAAYGATGDFSESLRKGVNLIGYTATPFFLAGVLGLYAVLWVDIVLGTLVACYCIYLLYRGTGLVMEVPPERGFLYASAVFAVALVSFVAMLGATVVLWDFGPTPEYTY